MRKTGSLTRRRLLSVSTLAGISTLAGCSGSRTNTESDPQTGRGEEVSHSHINNKAIAPQSLQTYWIESPYYSEVVHSIERKSKKEGYADLGTLDVRVGEVESHPRRNVGGSGTQNYEKGSVEEAFERIDIESEATFTHKIPPGYHYVELDGENLGREVTIDWSAYVYRYHRDPSAIDCSRQGEQIAANYIYIGEESLSAKKHLHYDVSYASAELDSYDLEVTVQTPEKEDRIRASQRSGDCKTTFIGSDTFTLENPLNEQYRLVIEVRDSEEVLATKTVYPEM